jgi:hypothetical protein
MKILCNQISVQAAVLDGFGEVGGLDIHLAFKVCNGSDQFQVERRRPC